MDNPKTQSIVGTMHRTKVNKTNATHNTITMRNTDTTDKPGINTIALKW
jgi:hypothetical protein